MKTREELITRALQKLKVLAAGQTPSAEDAQVVDNEIIPVLSDLAERDIYLLGDPDQIEDSAFVHLADILANSVAGDFGKDQSEDLRLMAEARLRRLNAATISYQPQQTEYF
jgi:hypothetical protein